MQYREISGLWSARVPDGPDSDQYPDTVLLEGHVTFEPQYRVPLVYPGEHIVIEPMHAVIHEGVLYGETVVGDDVARGPLFLPVTVDENANQTWSWVAKFQGMRLGEYGEEVTLPSVRFQVPAGDDALDLSEVIPVSQSGNTITLRGPGLSEEDAQALVDAGLDERGLLPDGSLPSVARAEVEQIVAEAVPSVAGVPIFETLAEAQAWEAENPGRVALTIEAPADTSAWQAAPPSFSVAEGTYTIPVDAGATYTVNGQAVAEGTYSAVAPSTVTVVAVAKPGYTLAGVMEWVQEFEENPLPYDGPASAAPFYFRLDEPAVHTGAPSNRGTSGASPWSRNAVFTGYGAAGAGVGATAVGGVSGQRWWLDDSTVPTAYTFACTINYHGASPGLAVYRDWANGKQIRIRPHAWDPEKTELPDGSLVSGFEGIHHVAWTWDGATRRVYIDGDLHMTDSLTWETSAAVVLGGLAGTTPTSTFAGVVIDRSRAWTQTEIQALSGAVTR